MKKNLFFLLVLIFSICGVLNYFEQPSQVSYAMGTNVSSWQLPNGKTSYEDLNESDFEGVTNSDYFTEGDNIYINSARGFAYFAYLANNGNQLSDKTIILTTDVDLGSYEWSPIFNFSGSFDGQNHVIYNMTITKGSKERNNMDDVFYAGLFGTYHGGVDFNAGKKIHNLHLRGVNINISDDAENFPKYIGGLIGAFGSDDLNMSTGGVVGNCSVKGRINVQHASAVDEIDVGGVMGSVSTHVFDNGTTNYTSNIMSAVTMAVNAPISNVGGIVGSASCLSLKNCYSESSITVQTGSAQQTSSLGGLVGRFNIDRPRDRRIANIENSYFIGDLNSSSASNIDVGGIVGRFYTFGDRAANTISNVYSVAQLNVGSSSTSKGGIIGFVTWETSTTGRGVLEKSFAAEGELGSEELVTDLCKINSASGNQQFSCENCIDEDVIDFATQIRTKGFYQEKGLWDKNDVWDFDNTWAIDYGVNHGLPYLKNVYQLGAANNDTDLSFGTQLKGEGTANNPYLIETAGDLAYFTSNYTSEQAGCYFSLQNDIDLSNKTWVPVGLTTPFSGVFDGNGHTISNLTSSYLNNFSTIGLFANTQNAVIKNLTIENCDFHSNSTSPVKGAFVGTAGVNTYLINVVNNSAHNGEQLADAGKGSENVTKIKGELNLKDTSGTYGGYDITIDPNGGTFYGKGSEKQEAYMGEYHIILDSEGNVVSQSIDSTLGKSIPALSTEFGKADTIIRRGYKMLGFTTEKPSETNSQQVRENDSSDGLLLDGASIVSAAATNLQIYTVWLSGLNGKLLTQDLYVVYNQYEVANFDAKLDGTKPYLNTNLYVEGEEYSYDGFKATYNSGVIAGVEGVGENNIYVKFNLIYDAKSTEYAEILWGKPQYSSGGKVEYLRNGYEIRALRTGFGSPVNGETPFTGEEKNKDVGFINSTYGNVLYAEWQGLGSAELDEEVKSQTITLTIKKAEEDSQWAGFDNFKWSEVFGTNFKNIQLQGWNEGDETASKFISSTTAIADQDDTAKELTFTFTYGWDYSDKATKYLKFNTEARTGFKLINSEGAASLNAPDDINFGIIRRSVANTFVQGMTFKNLRGSHNLVVSVERQTINSKFSASKETCFGLSPSLDLNGATQYDLEIVGTSQKFTGKASTTKFGYSFEDNKILFSTTGSSVEVTEEQLSGNKLTSKGNELLLKVTYSLNGGEQTLYFLYAVEQREDSLWHALYSCDESKGQKSLIAAMEEPTQEAGDTLRSSLDTFMHNSFNIIYKATEGSSFAQRVSNVAIDKDGADNTELRSVFPSYSGVGEQPTEGYFQYSGIQGFEKGDIILSTKYTQILINYTYKYNGENQDFNTLKNEGLFANITTQTSVGSEISGALSDIAKQSFEMSVISIKQVDGTSSGSVPERIEPNMDVESRKKFDFSTNTTGWNAGRYEFTITFVDITYTLNFGAKFVAHSQIEQFKSFESGYVLLLKDHLTDSQFLTMNDELNGAIEGDKVSGITLENNQATISLRQQTDLLYNSKISISPKDNNGVQFAGFYLRTNSGREFNSKKNYDTTFGEIYDAVSYFGGNRAVSQYVLNLIAVFEVKELTLGKTETVVIDNYNGTSKEQNATLSSLGLEANVSNISDYIYNYMNIASVSGLKTEFGFNLTGTNSAFYDVVGVRLGLISSGNFTMSEGCEWKGAKAGSQQSFDIKENLDKLLEKQSELTKTYLFQLIIRQHTAEITFHSGAGSDEQYRAGGAREARSGEVKNREGDDVANTTYIKTLYFGQNINLESGLTNDSKAIKTLYATRTGYTDLGWQVKNGDNVTTFVFNTGFNVNWAQHSSGASIWQVHIYKLWSANNYTIGFNSNGGEQAPAPNAITLAFDSPLHLSGIPNNVTRFGYNFLGWEFGPYEAGGPLLLKYADNVFTFDEGVVQDNKIVVSGTTYFVKEGEEWVLCQPLYEGNGQFALFARWQAKSYKVTVDYNRKSDESDKKVYDVAYDGSFAALLEDVNSQNLQRSKFNFLGVFYYVDEGTYNMVDATDVLTDKTLSVNFPENAPAGVNVLTLYVGWEYDYESAYALTLTDTDFGEDVYIGDAQAKNLSDKFTASNVANSSGFSIPSGSSLIGLSEDNNVSVKWEVDGETNPTQFFRTDVGTYLITVSITLTDLSKMSQTRNINGINLLFNYKITPAEIEFERDDDKARFVFAKKILEPYYPQAELEQLTTFGTASTNNSIVKYIVDKENLRNMDNPTKITTASVQEVYEYILVKFYLMGNSSGNEYKQFKDWTYQDYVSYKEENGEEVQNYLNNLKYFDYYSYGFTLNNFNAFFGDVVQFSAGSLAESKGVRIDAVKVVSEYGQFVPNSTYTLRIYLTASDSAMLNNFSLSTEQGGGYYIDFDKVYLLKENIELNNKSSYIEVYHLEGEENREVGFDVDVSATDTSLREKINAAKTFLKTTYGQTYYLIDEKNLIFASAIAITSNSGDAEKDTVFNFKDEINYIYLSELSVLTIRNYTNANNIEFEDVEGLFNLTIGEDYNFTIRNTQGVAHITVRAAFYSYDGENGFSNKFLNAENLLSLGLDTNILSDLLYISEIAYNLNGTKGTVNLSETKLSEQRMQIYAKTGTEGSGVHIADVEILNGYAVEIYAGDAITQIVFATRATLNDNIAIFQWAQNTATIGDFNQTWEVQKARENHSTRTWTMPTKEDLAANNETNLFAVYTDIIYVGYTNIPGDEASAYIKLGQTKYDDVSKPSVNGFTLDKLVLSSNENLGFEGLFDPGTGLYNPYFAASNHISIFQPIEIKSYWTIDTTIEYFAFFGEDYVYTADVFSFTEPWTVDTLLTLTNENTTLFTYSYEWVKVLGTGNQSMSKTKQFTLAGKGTYQESGTYRLIISSQLKAEYFGYVDEGTATSGSTYYEFTLQFLRRNVTTIKPTATESEYNGKNQITSWGLTISYTDANDYEEVFSVAYDPKTFSVTLDGKVTTAMINAGVYTIKYKVDDNYYDISALATSSVIEEGGQKYYQFTYTIKAIEVQLDDFSIEKTFNTLVGETSFVENVKTKLDESVAVTLTRDEQHKLDEHIGTYSLYLDATATFSPNFILKKGDLKLVENGKVLNTTQELGKFYIRQSGGLEIKFDKIDKEDYTVKFDASGYTFAIKVDGENIALQISCKGSVVKSYNLKFIDKTTGNVITNTTILDILKEYVEDFTTAFRVETTGSTTNTALESGAYFYVVTISPAFKSYYQTTEMSNQYRLIVERQEIKTDDWKISKVYDGTNTLKLNMNGEELVGSADMFVTATFSTIHVGSNLKVTLVLEGSDENLANYKITKSEFTNGAITKRKATMTFTSKATFTYGDVTQNNLKNLLTRKSVTDGHEAGGGSVEDILYENTFSLTYGVKLVGGGDVKKSARGFYFAGEYNFDVQVTSSVDFDFKIVYDPAKFTINQKPVTHPVTKVTKTVLDAVDTEILDTYFDTVTSDRLTLHYTISGNYNNNGKYRVGTYNFELSSVTSDEPNIASNFTVQIDPNNQGLQVTEAGATLYVEIKDEEIFAQNYISKDYSFNFSGTNINLNGGSAAISSAIEFYVKEDETVKQTVTEVDASKLVIFSGVATSTKFKNAGSYILGLSGTVEGYNAVAFAKTYIFVISKIEITVPDIVTKVYDGNNLIDVTNITGVIGGDTVNVSGRFENVNANEGGTQWNVSLTLSGEQSSNYELSSQQIKGTITKADAHFAYSGSNTAEFGTITNSYSFERFVTAFEGTSGSVKTVSLSQYELSVLVERTDGKTSLYSEANFLHAGTYTIKFSAVAEGTRNYTIPELSVTFTVTAHTVSVSFATAGQIQATFGEPETLTALIPYTYRTDLNENIQLTLTREKASENKIGYYKIVGAKIGEGEDYSSDYTIDFKGDSSEGAYQIVAPNVPLYVLLSSDETVNKSDYEVNNEIIKNEYDGKTYTSVTIGGDAENGYKLILTSSDGLSTISRDLNFYTANSDASVYTKYKESIPGLSAKITYTGSISRNIGTYWMKASSITAGDYSQSVKLGRFGETSCFALQITPKTVTLNVENGVYEQPFTNTDAIYHISNVDAPTMLDGLVDGEGFGFTLSLYENTGTEEEPIKGQIARYVNAKSCVVEGKIDEDDAVGKNYILDVANIKGRLTRVTLIVVINNMDYIYNYGEIRDNDDLHFEFEDPEGVENFDLYKRDKAERLNIAIKVSIEAEREQVSNYISTAGFLNAGLYAVRVYRTRLDDFNIQFKVDDSIYNDDSGLIRAAQVQVLPIQISLSQKDETFDQIFTKRYDGTTEIKFKNDTELRFNIDGVLGSDEVLISNVEYESELDGDKIPIIFTFGGRDIKNYDLSQIENKYFGKITAIRVKLAFDAKAEGSSVVGQNGEPVSDLFIKYPFENGNISASIVSGGVFPVEVLGKPGHAFLGWYMTFDVVSGSQEHTLLQRYASGLETDYADGKFRVKIENNTLSMTFFASLLEDSLLGYYYKDNRFVQGEQITFLLEADWSTNSYEVTINIVDQNGNPFSEEYSLATVEYAYAKDTASLKNVPMEGHSHSVMVVFDYAMRIGFSINDDTKCQFVGFYLGDTLISNLGDSNFRANATLLEISQVKDAYVFNLRFRITPVEITLDFSECESATIANTTDFTPQGGRVWSYSTNYFAIKDNEITLAAFLELAQFSTVGYDLTQLNDYAASSFANTYLHEILPSNPTDSRFVLNLVGKFEPKQIEVTLHFGYLDGEDEKVETHTIAYNTTFGDASWWSDVGSPTRTGFDFVEWNTTLSADGETIDEQTKVDQENEYVLYAIWEKQKVTVHFEVTNAALVFDTFEGLDVIKYDWGYEINRIDFGTTISFTITPDLGYELGELSNDYVPLGDGKYQFTIPANISGEKYLTYQISVNKISNEIILQGDGFIESYAAYEGEVAKEIAGDKFNVLTDNAFRIEVTAKHGYEMSEDFEVSGNPEENTNFIVSSNLENRTIGGQYVSVLTVYITGIKSGLTFTFATTPRANKISITFKTPEGDVSLETVDELYYENSSHSVMSNPYDVYVRTGEKLVVHVKFAYGFTYEKGNCTANGVTISDAENTDYVGYYKFEISGADADASVTISAKRQQFTLTVEVQSYDADGHLVAEGIPDNKAFVNGLDASAGVKIDYNTAANLTITKAAAFGFEGWLRMYEDRPFSTDESTTFTVTANTTIYAAFYEGENYTVWFGTVLLDTRYLQTGQELTRQQDYSIFGNGGLFYNSDEQLLSIGSESRQYSIIKNITATEFMYALPDGYDFAGFGYYLNNEFVVAYGGRADMIHGKAVFSIRGSQLASDVRDVYVIIQAKEIELGFTSEIEIENEVSGVEEPISEITIRSGINELNDFGYINNTRIHFAEGDFADGQLVSSTDFSIVAHSGATFELLINVTRKGFMLSRIDFTGEVIILNQENPNGDGLLFSVYVLSTNTGYFGIKLVYTSQLNFVDLAFVSERTGEDYEVDGGLFNVTIDEDSTGRAWSSSNETPRIRVSGYTNVGFSVTAFIRAGFTYKEAIITTSDGTNIVVGDIVYETLVIENTGFTGKVTFKVRDFLDVNSIKLMLTPTTYNVLFKDGENILLTRKIYYFENFEFGLEETAKLTIKKTNYVYQGYFTRQNGAGRLYVNTDVNFVGPWTENGYTLNSITPTRYVLDDNAQMLPDGSIEISLYLYMSYLTTRITFSFNTPLDVQLTALDLISGVNSYNSWYYFTEPMSIEVAYGTDLRFVGPKIAGFEFYKMIIAQRRPGESEWTYIDTSNYASANNVPWISDEADAYSECRVEFWYFRQINVQIINGLGTFTLSQDGYEQGSRGNAFELNQKGYYDPSLDVTVTAQADEGYEFVSWSVYPLIGRPSTNPTYTVKPVSSRQLTLRLEFAGKGVSVKFEYDKTNGNVAEVSRVGFNGENLGSIKNPTQIEAAVGDKLTLKMFTSPNYGLLWNYRDILGNVQEFYNIRYLRYDRGYQYFEVEILPEYNPNSWTQSNLPEITIMPTFESQRLSLFITTTLQGVLQGAMDENDVRNAGVVLYGGQEARAFTASLSDGDIVLDINVFDRYSITQIVITNKGIVYDNPELFEDNKIILSIEFIEANSIEGSISIDVAFKREIWDEQIIEVDELSGLGNEDSPYKITSVEDLILMMKLVNSGAISRRGLKYSKANYILTNDLNLNDKFWTPIGVQTNPFDGTFNFNGHKINGVYNPIFYEEVHYLGLFGVLGPNVNILMRTDSNWYYYLIIPAAIVLGVVLFVAFFYARKRKKARDDMSTK